MSARGLVLCFRPRLRAHVNYLLLWIENNHFRVLYPVFLFFVFIFFLFYGISRKKLIRVVTGTILYRDDTLDEEDILIIFDELEVPNSPL